MVFDKFPFTNFHEINTDWIVNKIKELATEWGSMQKEFATLEDAFEDLKKYVNGYFIELDIKTEVQKEIQKMKDSGELNEIIAGAVTGDVLKRINNPIVIILGDSYGTGYNSENPGVSWGTKLESNLKLRGYGVKSSYIGGYGFYGNGTKTYTKMLEELVATMTEADKGRVVKIIVGGSYNDRGGEAELTAAINNFALAVQSSFPNYVDVVICPMGWVWQGHTSGVHASTNVAMLMKVNKAWCTRGAARGFSVVPCYPAMWYSDSFSSDGVHPSQTGQSRIAELAIQAMGGCLFVPSESVGRRVVSVAKNTAQSTGEFSSSIVINQGTEVIGVTVEELSFINVAFNNIKLSPTSKILMGTVDDPVLRGATRNLEVPCTVQLRGRVTGSGDTTDKYVAVPGMVIFQYGNLYVRAIKVNEAKRDYENYDIVRISVYNSDTLWFNPLYQ